MNKTLSVNELNEILAKHFKSTLVSSVKVEVGSLHNQHNPKTIKLGPGSVLTLTVDVIK